MLKEHQHGAVFGDYISIREIYMSKGRAKTFLVYTAVFILAAGVILSIFKEELRGFVWMPDGEYLYYPFMTYTRDYFLNVARTLLHTGKLVFPTWDFSIGQGSSVLTAIRFDPFLVLACATPSKYLDLMYGFLSFLRWYTAGIVFILFCFRINKYEWLPVSLGALVYTFSGYAVFSALKHPYFTLLFLIYFPLLLIGAERFLQEKKWGVFVGAVFLLMIGNYYAAYINSLLMAVYVLIRQFAVNGRQFGKSLKGILQLLGLYALGLGLSMVIFLPTVLNFLKCSRSDGGSGIISVLYSLNTYLIFLMSAATPFSYAGWSQLSFLCIAFFAVAVLLMSKGKHFGALKAGLLVTTAFFVVPVFGYILNGFGYVSNRWCYGYAFCIALITVFAVPELFRLSGRQKMFIAGISVIYVGAVILVSRPQFLDSLSLNAQITKKILYTGIILIIAMLVAVLLAGSTRGRKIGGALMIIITAFSAVASVYMDFSPDYHRAIDDYFDDTGMMTALKTEEESVVKKIKDDSFYRTEVKANRANRFMMTGKYGTTAYWSAMPGVVTDFYQDFELDSLRQNYALWGLDNRAALCAADSVKYVLVHASSGRTLVPYGYDRVKTVEMDNSKFVFYENMFALPLGYTYDHFITKDTYEGLSPVLRQQALLQGAVTETAVDGLDEIMPDISAVYVPYTITDQEGITLTEDGIYKVTTGGHMTFSFEGIPDSETYLYLNGLIFHGRQNTDIAVSAGDVKKKSNAYNPAAYYYFEREGISFNLGYSEDGISECTVTFEKKGNYTFEPEIICLPMSDYRRDVTARREVVLEDIRENGDHITGMITSNDHRMLVFSIPDLGGWKVWIDGEETPVVNVNTMFFGCMIGPGEHTVELKYTPPGLKAGTCVSMVSLAAAAVLVFVSKRLRKKEQK